MSENERYLGDAVIAKFDGYGIELRLDDGTFQKVYLEPEVYRALTEFVDYIRQTHFTLPPER